MNILSQHAAVKKGRAARPAGGGKMFRQPLLAFVEFAADLLGVERKDLVRGDQKTLQLRIPAARQGRWPKPYTLEVALPAESARRRQVTLPEAAAWLWERATIEGGSLLARPVGQPEAVHEIAQRLFDAYQLDGGQMHLAGCRLKEVPFVRITLLAEDDPTEVVHHFFDAEGEPVPDSLVEELGLAQLVEYEQSHPQPNSRNACSLVAKARQQLAGEQDRFVAATLTRAKWAEGQIEFVLAEEDRPEQAARLSFEGWAASFQAPPFRCEASGLSTYHLAALEDGRIVAAEAIETCEVSGRRVLGCEMATCSVTGQRVDPTLVENCPVTGEPTLKEEFAQCQLCRQQVSKVALEKDICRACRQVEPRQIGDPVVHQLCLRFPALARYRKFLLHDQGRAIRLQAVGLYKSLFVVVDGDSEQVVSVATRTPFSRRWQQLPVPEWPAVLGGEVVFPPAPFPPAPSAIGVRSEEG